MLHAARRPGRGHRVGITCASRQRRGYLLAPLSVPQLPQRSGQTSTVDASFRPTNTYATARFGYWPDLTLTPESGHFCENLAVSHQEVDMPFFAIPLRRDL